MAEKRMFAKTIIDSDAFIDMPVSTRLLYYDLGMRADDDGFVNSPKKIMRMIGATDDDIKLLIAKKFIIPFDSGVVVIKHWRINNYLRGDRYKGTTYTKEKALLQIDDKGAYTLNGIPKIESGIPVGIPSGNPDKNRLDKVSIDKNRLDKYSIDNKEIYKEKYGEFKNVLLSEEEHKKLIDKFGEARAGQLIETLSAGIQSKGYKYKDHYAAILNWARRDEKEIKNGVNKTNPRAVKKAGDYTKPEDFRG